MAGLLIGHLLATIVVAAGVGGLVAGNHMALTVLTMGGAGYLLWLGINMLRYPAPPCAASAHASTSWWHWSVKGTCVSGLNPKVFLLFLALLPQFTDPNAHWSVPVQIIALGMVHAISCGVIYLLVGFSAQAVLQARPTAASIVTRISGAAMILIAAGLLAEQLLK